MEDRERGRALLDEIAPEFLGRPDVGFGRMATGAGRWREVADEACAFVDSITPDPDAATSS